MLENILLVAEMQELKANPNREAYGIVVEAQLDKNRGPVMSVLVQNGTLHVGDGILAGKSWGRVRAMTNETGRKMKSAEPVRSCRNSRHGQRSGSRRAFLCYGCKPCKKHCGTSRFPG